MKHRNTGTGWSESERSQLREYIKLLVHLVPVLCIFLLPGGLLLVPVLAEVVDRRKRARDPYTTKP